MSYLDIAIKICDSWPNEFPTEKEAWEYEREFGRKKEPVKRNPFMIYVYQGDIYYNFGKEQRFVERITFKSTKSNPEEARKEFQYTLKAQRSVKNVKLKEKYMER